MAVTTCDLLMFIFYYYVVWWMEKLFFFSGKVDVDEGLFKI